MNLLQKGLKLEEEKSYYVHSTSSQNVTVADSDYQGVLMMQPTLMIVQIQMMKLFFLGNINDISFRIRGLDDH